MRIQKIETNCNRTTFGEIYRPVKNRFTDSQKKVADDIVKTLRNPSEKYNNMSAEDFYKSKKGMVFCISGYDDPQDSIRLESYSGTRSAGIGIDEKITYHNPLTIGVYDEKHSFKTDDVDFAIKKRNRQDLGLIIPMALVLATLIGMVIAGRTRTAKTQNLTKPLIETVDSTLNTKLNLPLTK